MIGFRTQRLLTHVAVIHGKSKTFAEGCGTVRYDQISSFFIKLLINHEFVHNCDMCHIENYETEKL